MSSRIRGRPRTRKRRNFRKTPKLTRSLIRSKNVYMRPHKFSRMAGSKLIDLTGSSDFVGAGYQFTLNDVNAPTEFGHLFDQYKIDFIELTLNWSPESPIVDDSLIRLNANQALGPVLYYFKDYDDSNAPVSLQELQERAKTKIRRFTTFGNMIKIRVKPAVLQEIYRSAVSTSYGTKFNQVLDMADRDVPHYGVKIGIKKQAFNMGKIVVDMKYYFTCYNAR